MLPISITQVVLHDFSRHLPCSSTLAATLHLGSWEHPSTGSSTSTTIIVADYLDPLLQHAGAAVGAYDVAGGSRGSGGSIGGRSPQIRSPASSSSSLVLKFSKRRGT